ncbi:UNVERIFIED_CONTAM: hypothetical protein Slati_1761300 [Sesamum latifolium]|uniref:Transposase MuDR plant domain-containing protein n=1 Tax=Sesamum latifolium TaxID=2727402 RepID=A0AAW2WXL3_9LAMI
MSINILEGGEGIRELLRDYKGCNVISIYIEEKAGPLLSVDTTGNILNSEEVVPLLQYSVEGAGDEEDIEVENEGVGVEEGVENEGVGVEEGVENEDVGVEEGIEKGAEFENEGVGVKNEGVEAEAGNVEEGTEAENEGAWVQIGVFWGDYVDWGEVQGDFQTEVETGVDAEVQTRVEGEVGTGVENEVKNDESESNSDSSLISDCPSWMLEDLEGPLDDLYKNNVKNSKGSDDEGYGCPVWDERMDMGEVDLTVDMKFETRAKFRDVMRDSAVRRGWDLKLVKNEKHMILATCKNECNWKLRASSVMKSTTFQIKSIKEKQILDIKLKISKPITRRDPNDNIYPIVVAYVEVEEYDSWEWFLNLLLRDIGSQNERGWTFISYRPKGLLEAIAELAPGAKHKLCLRHMLKMEDFIDECFKKEVYLKNLNEDRQRSSTSHGVLGSMEKPKVPSIFSQPSQDSQPQVPLQPIFQFSPMFHHLKQPQENLLRLFIQSKLLNNLSNNNINNPQEFISNT